MYNSPIEMLITDIQHQIVKEQDEEIYKAVVHYIPNVDKEELLRALQYDRNQYEKGYADGKRDATPKWISVKDRLPEKQKYDWVLVQLELMPEKVYGVPCVAEFRDGDWYDADGCWIGTDPEGGCVIVTHWMPLPQPPKGE